MLTMACRGDASGILLPTYLLSISCFIFQKDLVLNIMNSKLLNIPVYQAAQVMDSTSSVNPLSL